MVVSMVNHISNILYKRFKEVENNYSMDELILIQSIRRWRPKDEFLPTIIQIIINILIGLSRI